MKTDKSFAELLLYWRSKAGLSQEELAQKSGVSKVQIAKYETNKSTPRLKAIMRLADALGVNEADLGYVNNLKLTKYEKYSIIIESLTKLDKSIEEMIIPISDTSNADLIIKTTRDPNNIKELIKLLNELNRKYQVSYKLQKKDEDCHIISLLLSIR